MSISAIRKKEVMKEYAESVNDTGSVHVQCAVLTERISNLTTHLKSNHKDFASRRGLQIMVGRRRRLLNYLKKKSAEQYSALIQKLGIRK